MNISEVTVIAIVRQVLVRGAVPVVLSLTAGIAAAQVVAPDTPSVASKVDALFSEWDSTATPGCAVGVARGGALVFGRGYGMADLEHDAVITPDTIFEAGSVSKQFTAAAVLLLGRDGKLSLDDPVRKHLPELPEYTAPVTIRHMLQHTSGLRDWGDIAELSGWPRTTRAYTHAHVLDSIARQTAPNFAPGADWSYSNSGYNLAAMIVARVSGQTFAEFTRARLFEPLGLRHTSWRDDRRRIVRGRATAYDVEAGRFVTLMPFEDVHGNGGLLTTVGDLLLWNEHLQAGRVGDPAFVRELETPGKLANGTSHGYAFGLFVGEHKGVREISHGGATAGYRAFLTRFPDVHLSIALLCNVGTANAARIAHEVADLYLGAALKPPRPLTAIELSRDDVARLTGEFRGAKRGDMLSVVREKDGLRVADGPPFVQTAPGRFVYGGVTAEVFPESGPPVTRIRVTRDNGTEDVYERVPRARPAPDQLAQYVGTYRTPEVEADLQVVVDDGVLTIRRRPDRSVPLRPLYADAFDSRFGLVRFARAADGRVTHLRMGTNRAWDVRFARVPDPPPTFPTR